jgi:hypothetical protein
MILRMSRKYVHQTSEAASATNDVGFHRKTLTGLSFCGGGIILDRSAHRRAKP